MGHRVPLRALALALAPFGVGLAGLVVFLAIVTPPSADLPRVVVVFLGLAAMTSLAGVTLPRLAARLDSVGSAVLVVALASMGATALAMAASATFLMLAPSESTILLLLVAFGVGLGLVLEVMVARSLASDLRRLLQTARAIAAGDLNARTAVDRSDEVGRAAQAIDSMARQLAELDDERARARAAREAFLTAISHDLRTPLAALQAAVEALEDGLAPDPERYFSAIHSDLDAMRNLVDNLFLLARIEAGRFEFPRAPVDLAELADEAVEALTPVARLHGISLQMEREGQAAVSGGPTELSRTMRNLLDNAIRHAPAGSRVLVEVRAAEDATVNITDEGDGFPEEIRKRLEQATLGDASIAPRAGGGTGLGLLIAKGLVEAHGGRLSLERGPGGRVSFRLPLADGADAATLQSVERPGSGGQRGRSQ